MFYSPQPSFVQVDFLFFVRVVFSHCVSGGLGNLPTLLCPEGHLFFSVFFNLNDFVCLLHSFSFAQLFTKFFSTRSIRSIILIIVLKWKRIRPLFQCVLYSINESNTMRYVSIFIILLRTSIGRQLNIPLLGRKHRKRNLVGVRTLLCPEGHKRII